MMTLLLHGNARAQLFFSYPTIVFEAPTWKDFVPKGWEVLQVAETDFNEDKAIDYAIILQHKEEVVFTDAHNHKITGKPRLLFIVTKAKPRYFYRLVEQSNTFILPYNKEQNFDPFKGMKAERGLLFFDFVQSPLSTPNSEVQATYIFRFHLARFYLFGANYHIQNRKKNTYEMYLFNFPNSRVALRKGTEEEGDDFVQSKLLPRMMLQHFGTMAAPFTWEVMKGVKL